MFGPFSTLWSVFYCQQYSTVLGNGEDIISKAKMPFFPDMKKAACERSQTAFGMRVLAYNGRGTMSDSVYLGGADNGNY